MKAELVENTKGERRILLTSEDAGERELIRQIANAGTAIVLVCGSERKEGSPATEHYVSLVAGERVAEDGADEPRSRFHDDFEDDENDEDDEDRFEGTIR
ncbi:MAG: hypothetical protein R3B99_35895 [Polyangiales bacterium]|nr:hypothetical protein [Myxococcales bacterium]MCB9601271.1 hypothetical protein [Sandaracinus sp.]